MLTIILPDNHIEERQYIINVIIKEFLGLEYAIYEKNNLNSTIIQLENGNRLKLNDCFFNKFDSTNTDYLDIKNIPEKIITFDCKGAPEKNIIGLYGKPEINITTSEIYSGIDILASAFFMLTRWEEHVSNERDNHDRFPAQQSLAYKNNFLSRPIVNEYVEIIWMWLKDLGITQNRKKRTFQFVNTHDIDRIKLFEKPRDYLAKPIKALLTDKTLSSFLYHTKIAIQSKQKKDPYDVFDYFMDTSERRNIKSHFFFMAAATKTKFDNGYNIKSKLTREIIKKIIDRGHIVGIHPSYMTLNNPELLRFEINTLREVTGKEILCGRQHYLRFNLPNTWQHWDDNKIEWDSSLGYSGEVGFRCGTCYSFPVFNIITRKTLKLREKPLIIMDATLRILQLDPIAAKDTIDYYLQIVKKYSGEFVFLWHNSSFSYLGWREYSNVYKQTLDNFS